MVEEGSSSSERAPKALQVVGVRRSSVGNREEEEGRQGEGVGEEGASGHQEAVAEGARLRMMARGEGTEGHRGGREEEEARLGRQLPPASAQVRWRGGGDVRTKF